MRWSAFAHTSRTCASRHSRRGQLVQHRPDRQRTDRAERADRMIVEGDGDPGSRFHRLAETRQAQRRRQCGAHRPVEIGEGRERSLRDAGQPARARRQLGGKRSIGVRELDLHLRHAARVRARSPWVNVGVDSGHAPHQRALPEPPRRLPLRGDPPPDPGLPRGASRRAPGESRDRRRHPAAASRCHRGAPRGHRRDGPRRDLPGIRPLRRVRVPPRRRSPPTTSAPAGCGSAPTRSSSATAARATAPISRSSSRPNASWPSWILFIPSTRTATWWRGAPAPPTTSGRYPGFVYLPCTADNAFEPALPRPARRPHLSLLSKQPHRRGGHTRGAHALGRLRPRREAIILFDAAYEAYVVDPDVPRSIYEIPGAREVAIESRSFSKTAGFTGMRLAYTVVPKEAQRPGRRRHAT